MNKFTTIKVWLKTHRLAKILAAYSNQSLVAFLHRIVVEEANRLSVND